MCVAVDSQLCVGSDKGFLLWAASLGRGRGRGLFGRVAISEPATYLAIIEPATYLAEAV